MKVTEHMLDTAAEILAGRLMLIVHLEDVELRCLGLQARLRDHERLALYGYDMSDCVCSTERYVEWLQRIGERNAQKRS